MLKRSTPLPVMVLVAVVALVMGSFGTATAAGLTKAQVKKIATKVVNKKAPSLSVAHATSADAASTLGGLAPSAFQGRVVQTTASNVAMAAGARTNVAGPISITVPAGQNFLILTGEVSIDGNPNDLSISWFQVDDNACTTATGTFATRPFDSLAGGGRSTLTQSRVVKVTAGTHSVVLCAESGAASTVNPAVLVAQTAALNGAGGTTLPAGPAPRSTRNDLG